MDIEYDMMRSARDARFLYIRNFAPDQPYAGHIVYRNQSAIMQEWLAAGGWTVDRQRSAVDAELTAARGAVHTRADPHQVNNLAADPAQRQTLERMRRAVERPGCPASMTRD